MLLRIELDERCMNALAYYFGRKRMTREAARTWADVVITAAMEGIVHDFDNREDE